MNDHRQQTPSDLDRILSDVSPDEAARLREVWDWTEDGTVKEAPDPVAAERVWNALAAFAEAHAASPQQARPDRGGVSHRHPAMRRSWMAVAATLLIAAAVGLFILWPRPIVKTAAAGQRLAVSLPDGSHIELNSGSTLRYARRFGAERHVALDGEAFFDVAKEERPFVVRTFNAQVTVLGTRFNVRAWRESMDPGTSVALASGRVALQPLDRPDRAVTLTPGQSHRIARGVHAPGSADSMSVALATAWRDGDLVFKDEWLGVILEDVERRFAVHVTLQPPTLRETRIGLALRNPADAEAVLRAVCAALNLSYRETADGYEIYSRTPP